MANERLRQLYDAIDAAVTILNQQLKTTFLAAVVEAGEDLASGTILQEQGVPDDVAKAKLGQLFAPIKLSDYTPEEIRTAIQLVLVKAVQVDRIEPNQQVTPDAMANLATYLITVFAKHLPQKIRVADLAVGTGNLLFAVIQQLQATQQREVQGFGVDNDEDLLAVASMGQMIQKAPVELFHQDALDPLLFDNIDIVVSDLPVGYYPIDSRAKSFALAAKKGHSFAHHLLIEQSMRVLKPGGLGLFFVPSSVFTSSESKGLMTWLAEHQHFQGLLKLPAAFFADQAAEKSLLILQRPGADAVQVPQVLIGQFPDPSDKQAFADFLAGIRQWASKNLSQA